MIGPKFRSFLIFLVALAVPVSFVAFFLYAKNEAKRQTDEFTIEKKKHPDTDRMSVDNYELKEVGDDNQIKWRLTAKSGTLIPSNKDVWLQGVKMIFVEDGKTKMTLSAPYGLTNEITRHIQLNGDFKGIERVVAEGEDGKARLEAAQVELKQKNQFLATGGVTILWPGVAKVSGKYAEGSVAKGADLKNIKIVGNTHALVGTI